MDAKEKARALTDYQKRLAAVESLKEMTDTDAWKEFHRGIRSRIDQHALLVLDAEKSRDVIHHQEGVKILRDIIVQVREPVTILEAFIREQPLFAQAMEVRATWNDALGTIDLRRI